MPKCSLQFQLCFYPFFDGGFYCSGPCGPLTRMVRVSLGVVDFRIWWDDRRGFIPFDVYPDDEGKPK